MTSFYFFLWILLIGGVAATISIKVFENTGNTTIVEMFHLSQIFIFNPLIIISILWMAYDLFSSFGTYIYNYIMNF